MIEPAEASVVPEIFRHFASGWSPRQIAAELNRRQVASPRGGFWRSSAILGRSVRRAGILACEAYIGRLIWNRSAWSRDPDSGKRRRLERPESEWIVVEQPELRIVDDVLWDAAQRRLRDQRQRTEGARRDGKVSAGTWSKHLLSGLLKCGGCG